LDSDLCRAADTGEDWPRFLGPRANNISTETGLLDRWPTNGPPVLWDKAVGAGYSAPSVRGELLVLHQRVKDEEVCRGLRGGDGRSRWRHAIRAGSSILTAITTARAARRCSPATAATPSARRETGLPRFANRPARLAARHGNGLERAAERSSAWGSTPLLEGDRLIVMVGGQPNAGVVALDAATGQNDLGETSAGPTGTE
jgi:hypothetical protein